MPLSRISTQPRPSSVWSRPTSRPTISERRKPAGEAEQQHGAVAQAAQRAAIERLQHGDEILGQHGFLLQRRAAVAVADAGEHGGDMAVLAVERLAALGIVPGQGGEAALDRRHRIRLLCRPVAVPEARR